MPQPWTSSASASLDGGIVTLVEGSSLRDLAALGRHAARATPTALFFRDTRFLSELRLRVNGEWPEPLAAHDPRPVQRRVRAARRTPQVGPRRLRTSWCSATDTSGRGMREDVTVHNYGEEPAFCAIELHVRLRLRGPVRGQGGPGREGRATSPSTSPTRRPRSATRRGSFRRGARLDFSEPPQLSTSASRRSSSSSPPAADWSLCVQLTPLIDGQEVTPRYLCGVPVEHADAERAARGLAARTCPRLTTDHDSFQHLLARSTEDLAALRLFDPEQPDRTVVAAGAPWFMTLFGRDSLLTSWMAMIVDSDLALGTLQTLAQLQGRDVNPITEEEPGRILHEMRFGESARALARRRQRLLRQRRRDAAVRHAARRAPALGQPPGGGRRAAPRRRPRARLDRRVRRPRRRRLRRVPAHHRTAGSQNQGWKDSWDSVHFADGRLARAADRALRGAGVRVRRARSPAPTSRSKAATTSSPNGSGRGPRT